MAPSPTTPCILRHLDTCLAQISMSDPSRTPFKFLATFIVRMSGIPEYSLESLGKLDGAFAGYLIKKEHYVIAVDGTSKPIGYARIGKQLPHELSNEAGNATQAEALDDAVKDAVNAHRDTRRRMSLQSL